MPSQKKALPAEILKLCFRKVRTAQLEADKKTPKRHPETKAILFHEVAVPLEEHQVFDYDIVGNTLVVVSTDAKKIPVELNEKQLTLMGAETEQDKDAKIAALEAQLADLKKAGSAKGAKE